MAGHTLSTRTLELWRRRRPPAAARAPTWHEGRAGYTRPGLRTASCGCRTGSIGSQPRSDRGSAPVEDGLELGRLFLRAAGQALLARLDGL